jgi:DNA helicase HerA-like ATPase
MSDLGGSILLGRGTGPAVLHLRYANRHGLISGATGTGKTITLQVLAEAFSRAGVPVFCADVKGDLSGISQPGTPNAKLEARARELGVDDFAYEPTPVIFWDLLREQGHPLRATVSEMGPLLLARLLELNDTQEGVLHIAFRLADEQGLLLLDFHDLTAMLQFVAEHAGELTTVYGNVSRSSIGAIQRRLLVLEEQGGTLFFGEPALALEDLLLLAPNGRGAVNVLMADRLIQSPRLYATFLLWLLSELFEELPEVGDVEKPKLVFFFDEAHLLFRDAPRALIEKVEQVVRLIRSKGVGVYFVTQNPLDVPQPILSQLGNRIQHALRAYTPAEQRAVRAAAETFRPNPAFATAEAITQLAVGEALVSTLERDGVPSMVQRVKIVPPRSRIGPITAEERSRVLASSPLAGKYDATINRESAYELLLARAQTAVATSSPQPLEEGGRAPVRGTADPWGGMRAPTPVDPYARAEELQRRRRHITSSAPSSEADQGLGGLVTDILTGAGGRRQGLAETLVKSVARTVGSQIGRAVLRGVLGSILKR